MAAVSASLHDHWPTGHAKLLKALTTDVRTALPTGRLTLAPTASSSCSTAASSRRPRPLRCCSSGRTASSGSSAISPKQRNTAAGRGRQPLGRQGSACAEGAEHALHLESSGTRQEERVNSSRHASGAASVLLRQLASKLKHPDDTSCPLPSKPRLCHCSHLHPPPHSRHTAAQCAWHCSPPARPPAQRPAAARAACRLQCGCQGADRSSCIRTGGAQRGQR